jgi:hypothetical protein
MYSAVVTRSTIDSLVLKSLDIPVFKLPVKGVYFKFEDFINNKPPITEYSVLSTDKADFLYLKSANNNETLQENIWGYCDGKDFFVYAAENFFKLHQTGKTFAIYGAKDYRNVRVFRMNFAAIDAVLPNSTYSKSRTRSRYKLVHETLILDMETGELF